MHVFLLACQSVSQSVSQSVGQSVRQLTLWKYDLRCLLRKEDWEGLD